MEKEITNFAFLPGVNLNPGDVFEIHSIKGKRPAIDYGFTFSDIYPHIPVADLPTAYHFIRNICLESDRIISKYLAAPRTIPFPRAENRREALECLNALFSIHHYYPEDIRAQIELENAPAFDLFAIEVAMPFSLSNASPEKLLDSIHWIDTNIKLQIENILIELIPSSEDIKRLVHNAFKIFARLLKCEDYLLARRISFNYSMFIQERIITLLFNFSHRLSYQRTMEEGQLTNDIALSLLKQYTDPDYHKMIQLGTFMGIAWANHDQKRSLLRIEDDKALSQLERALEMENQSWCINHSDDFLNEVQRLEPKNANIAVILDDNGESVFDLALCQNLLRELPFLNISFVVNQFPISNNISTPAFNALLQDRYFKDLKKFIRDKRALVIAERQVFRSFEPDLLSPESKTVLDAARLIYIKGANFFETFQYTGTLRYYCFTVHSFTSQLLTGCQKGNGIFLKVPVGRKGFYYDNSQTMVSSMQISGLNEWRI